MDSWLIQILGWIGAFIFGVFVNLATPSIKTFFQKSSLSFRKRQVAAITKKYEIIKGFKGDNSNLAVQSLRLMAQGFRRLTLLIALGIAIVVTGIRIGFNEASANFVIYLIAIVGGYVSSKFDDIEVVIKDTIQFTQYKERTKKQLERWGGNPEDLDKEEMQSG